MLSDDSIIDMDEHDGGCGSGSGGGNNLAHAAVTELEEMVVEMVTRSDEPGACRAILLKHGHTLAVLTVLFAINAACMLVYKYIDLDHVQVQLATLQTNSSPNVLTNQLISYLSSNNFPINVTRT
jgi:hypothetical protein